MFNPMCAYPDRFDQNGIIMRIASFFALVLVLMAASACSSTQYGNYLTAPPAIQQKIADDAVDHINNTYQAGKTALIVAQKADDEFGVALLDGLRKKGFAVGTPAASDDNPGKPATGETLAYALG